MNSYCIQKILSNNVVLVEKENKEYIFIGKGIGFGKKKGDVVSSDMSVEKTFFAMGEENRKKYDQLLESISKEVIAVSEEIIALAAKELQTKMNEYIHIALADHINFFIKRQEAGIEIANPFMAEIESLYEDEYLIAQKGADLIEKRLGIKVPQEEIGFVTLHIHSGKADRPVSKTLQNTRLYREIVETIEKEADIYINPKSINYARLITHVRFAIERLKNGQIGKNILLDNIRDQFKQEYAIACKIAKLIEEAIGTFVPEDEIGYLTIHIYRIWESAKLNNNK